MGELLSIPMTLELNGFDESQLEFKWECAIQNKLSSEYHFKDPDVNVVEMHTKDAYAYMMFIALNKGDKGYVYRFWISSNGMPQVPAEGLFPLPKEDDMIVPYEAMGPYDEIVDMEYKSKTW